MLDNVRARARAYSARCCVCPVFRPALIVVAGWMPRESPSSSRGPPTSSPCQSARFRASRKASPPPTCRWRWWGELRHVGGVKLNHAQSRCPFTSPARSSNVFRRGLWRGLRDYDHLSLSLARAIALVPSYVISPGSAYHGVRWLDFFFFLFLSLFFCLIPLSSPCRNEDKLCSCLSRSLPHRLGHAKRRLSSFSFSLEGFSQYMCTHRIFRRSFSRLPFYIFFPFISFPLYSTASIR